MTLSDTRFAQYKSAPKFCIITPTAYLEQYASQSSMHLILAHLVDTDDAYANFYATRDEYKIMDCSAFELGVSYDPEKLLDLAHKCRADVIVLPDYPAQPAEVTINSALEHAIDFKAAGFKTMFVPHAEIGDTQGWIDCYKWAANAKGLVDIIGMSILAVPNAIPHVPKAYARVVMTEMLIAQNLFSFDTPHHYLGLNSGPNVELPTLITRNTLSSCDSSNPVWAGINGLMYNQTTTDFLPINKKFLREVDFDQEMTSKQYLQNVIQFNINVVQDIIQNPGNYIQ